MLFAASFIPYFLPEKYVPTAFKDGSSSGPLDMAEAEATKPKVDRGDVYVQQQLDALFASEELPKSKK